jgi:Family of unknown function (DUF6356)
LPVLKSSREHLTQAGESYFEHMRFALLVGAMTVGAGLACIIHAIVPALCTTSCSRTVVLLQRLFADRSQLGAVSSECSGVLIFVLLMAVSSLTAVVVGGAAGLGFFGVLLVLQAYALPMIYLSQNPGLDPLANHEAFSPLG